MTIENIEYEQAQIAGGGGLAKHAELRAELLAHLKTNDAGRMEIGSLKAVVFRRILSEESKNAGIKTRAQYDESSNVMTWALTTEAHALRHGTANENQDDGDAGTDENQDNGDAEKEKAKPRGRRAAAA